MATPATRQPQNRTVKPCLTCGKEKPIVARGLCGACYADVRRHSDEAEERRDKVRELEAFHGLVAAFALLGMSKKETTKCWGIILPHLELIHDSLPSDVAESKHRGPAKNAQANEEGTEHEA
jgi:hypothetical protein